MQALYLPAGNLHAYLSGVGIEIMANSDNVLRGGLTPKHVDVPELMRVLDFDAATPRRCSRRSRETRGVGLPDPGGGVPAVPARADAGHLEITHDGPQVLLTVDGELEVERRGRRRLRVPRGRSVWVCGRRRPGLAQRRPERPSGPPTGCAGGPEPPSTSECAERRRGGGQVPASTGEPFAGVATFSVTPRDCVLSSEVRSGLALSSDQPKAWR